MATLHAAASLVELLGVRIQRAFALVLLGAASALCGCVEVSEHISVRTDGSLAVRAVVKIDPEFEDLVLSKMKSEAAKKLPAGARIDFSQRIDGKATIIIEAEGEAADQMRKEDGSTTITVSDAGLFTKRYEYREIVQLVPPMPFPNHAVIVLPGSIEHVTGGRKVANDTVEFDRTRAKRGDSFVATSTAFALNFGDGRAAAFDITSVSSATWLLPTSVASIIVGAGLLAIGWFRARSARGLRVVPVTVAAIDSSAEAPATEGVLAVFCTECGAVNSAGRKFCSQCGHALE